MNSTAARTSGLVSLDDNTFDTQKITETLNRLLSESSRADHEATVSGFQVLGYRENQPTTLCVVATVCCQANNCIVEVPYDVDAGALKGLEVGVGAD